MRFCLLTASKPVEHSTRPSSQHTWIYYRMRDEDKKLELAVVEGVGPVHGVEPAPPGQLVRLESVDRAANH